MLLLIGHPRQPVGGFKPREAKRVGLMDEENVNHMNIQHEKFNQFSLLKVMDFERGETGYIQL